MNAAKFIAFGLCFVGMAMVSACTGDDDRFAGPALEREAAAQGDPPRQPRTEPTTGRRAPRDAERRARAGTGRAADTVIRGSGRFLGPAASRVDVDTTPEGDVTLNFVNADIREVVRSVLGQILRLNYTIDPGVQGVVTLQTSRPLTRDAVLPAFESVLRSSGFSMVFANGLYRVVSAANAPRFLQAPRLVRPTARTRSGYRAVIVPLRFASAQAIADLVKPFAAPEAMLRVDAGRNLVILAGTSEEIATITEIIDIFDVDWFSGMSFAVIRLNEAKAKDVAKELGAIFGEDAAGPLAGLVRIVPFDRLNALLVATPRPVYIDRVRQWVDRLDQGAETTDRRIYVYPVENGRATDLADVLDQLFTGRRSRAPPTDTGRLAPGRRPATLRSRSIFDSSRGPNGTSETAQSQTGPIAALRARRDGQPEMRTETPSRSDVPGSQPALAVPSAQDENALRIIADDTNNALLILATPAEYRQIVAALKQLDVQPLQVLIEATIAEVTLNEDLRYGVQWFLRSGNSSITLSNVVGGAIVPAFPGFAYTFSSGSDATVVLDALDEVTNVKLLSSPQLLVRDNSTATIEVGDQVPVATQSATSVIDPDSPIVNTIEFRDTGVLLSVTPRVNASGLVNLDIAQEVSSAVQTTTSGIDSPTIQQRRIESSVIVHDGDTVALGGLIENESTRSRDGVPFLSRIPYLGTLFGSRSERLDRTELLVLITPRVIRNREEAQRVTEELRSKVRVLTRQPTMKREEKAP